MGWRFIHPCVREGGSWAGGGGGGIWSLNSMAYCTHSSYWCAVRTSLLDTQYLKGVPDFRVES